ncbi:glycosyltransferase [Allobranchiibius sp. CTAmp26]|uniref:glycosyltransferase n=1 Tax=Allobranchiibius sp. CTAmp26 TaxID=2815214 RepID=UPI001AA173C9|nr:glycosyltransferase [Allobranchiibius sp. CTAmp26]MBO1756225.1 glycosyltransferase family 4 protein [Allobranchiibius sp. CTAmp26]
MIVPNGGWPVRPDGDLQLPVKLISGLQAYAAHWPGPITLLTRGEPDDGSGPHNLGSVWLAPSQLPCDVLLSDDLPTDLVRLAPDVVLASLEPGREWLLELPAPVVLVSEVPVSARTDYLVHEAGSRTAAARIRLGAVRVARAERALVRRSAGVQCNGWAAFDAYAGDSKDALLFFDTRLRAEQIPAAQRAREPGPLRLSYSARHSPEKGPQFVLDLQAALNRRGVAAITTLYGRGPLTEELRARDVPGVQFAGDVDFDDTWVPQVRDDVDLMVLPHLLGDPSGTYLESVGLGVPVLGFDNDALAALVRETGAGWTVPTGDGAALAERAAYLAEHPGDVAAAAAKGIDFMRGHPFETEFDRRVQHLVRVAERA